MRDCQRINTFERDLPTFQLLEGFQGSAMIQFNYSGNEQWPVAFQNSDQQHGFQAFMQINSIVEVASYDST